MKVLFVFTFPLLLTEARPWYRQRIPNGNRVPHPEIPGSVWAGVGHNRAGGGGPRNPFGKDFADAGFRWTVPLCEKDSDGDGRSNGQELGDPECVWSEGDDPAFRAESHPGVADSVTELPGGETCSDYVPPNDLKTLDIAFTGPNELDGSRTEYICEQFRVSAPGRANYYHQVRSEPLIDNTDVLHHIWIYICDGVSSSDGNRVGDGSYSCSGIEGNCQIVAGWALGMSDVCEPANVGAGVPFGWLSGNAVFKVEAHYDNSQGQVTTDQSGMRLHLTSSLRPLEAGQVILGMDYWDRQFELEAGQSLVARQNICPTEATQRLQHPVYVYAWNPHMHLYGRSLVTEHYRCGEKIGEIGNIPNFEFNNQQSYVLDPPVKVLPGDALVTTCYYDTSTSDAPIVGGEETTDEMCDNYLSYYPSAWTSLSPNLFTMCVSYEEGLNPEFSGNDDDRPFAILDLDGNIIVRRYDADPSRNEAPCCRNGGAANCEARYKASANEACGIDSDCRGSLECRGGLCKGTFSDSGSCFSSHAIATVKDKGKVAMKDISVGDKVLTASGQYQTVYTINHFHPTKPTNFVQIHTNLVGSNVENALEVSPMHLVYIEGKEHPVPAINVQVGDYMQTLDYGPQKVNTIRYITRNGLYNPITTEGTMLVDGIKASSYTSFTGSAYLEIAGMEIIDVHKLLNMTIAPYRAFCMTTSSLNLCNRHEEGELPGPVEFLSKFYDFWSKQSAPIQAAILSIYLFFFGLIHLTLSGCSVVMLAAAIGWVAMIFLRYQFGSLRRSKLKQEVLSSRENGSCN